MIEKNSEVMTASFINSVKKIDDNSFLDCVDKKKKEMRDGNEDSVTVAMLRLFPELLHKKMMANGELTSGETKNKITEKESISISKIIPSMQKSHTILANATGIKKFKETVEIQNTQIIKESKESDNHHLQIVSKMLSHSRPAAADITTVDLLTMSGKFMQSGNDSETRKKMTEMAKDHSIIAQLKSDTALNHQESPEPEMKQRTAQSSIADRLFLTNANKLTEVSTDSKKALSINYPFLRWSGDHSVKVSIPVSLSRAGNLTLLPSDPRAAEILSRQIGQLGRYTAELLHPQRDDDESEQRRGKQAQGEEKE